MKFVTALTCCLLAACSQAPVQDSETNASFPITISHLASRVDEKSGQVDVEITIKSGFRENLKTVRVLVAAYDSQGVKLTGDDESIEILGPITRGQSLGPLDKVTAVRARTTPCVQVVQVQVVKLDYSTQTVVDKAARELVSGNPRSCTSQAGP